MSPHWGAGGPSLHCRGHRCREAGRPTQSGFCALGPGSSVSGPQFPSLFREELRSKGPPAVSWFHPLPPASHCVAGKLRLGEQTGFPLDEGGRAGHSIMEPGRATQVGTCRKRLRCGQLSLPGEGPPSPALMCTPRSVHPCHVPRHACPPSHPMPTIHVQQLSLICCVSASPAPHPGPMLTPVHAQKSWYSPHMPGTGHLVLHTSLALLET